MKPSELKGKRFKKLLVIKEVSRNSLGRRYWKCKCDCGKVKNIRGSSLTTGKTVSCGCYGKSLAPNKLSEDKAAFNACFDSLKRRAKNKKLTFNISKKKFRELTQQKCYYCDEIPKQCYKNQYNIKNSYFYNGLDRIDNNKGYTIDNVLTSCGRCNKLRGTELTVEETKLLVKTLLDFRKNNENR